MTIPELIEVLQALPGDPTLRPVMVVEEPRKGYASHTYRVLGARIETDRVVLEVNNRQTD